MLLAHLREKLRKVLRFADHSNQCKNPKNLPRMRLSDEMKYGLYVQNFGEYSDPHNLVALALDAEEAGWDGFFLWDHLLLYRHSDIPFVDAGIALAAIAARTERLKLGPVITPVARRRPWKIARELVSLDHLSRGRAVLGVGLGAPADAEFECFGEDPDDRVRARRLDEGLEIIAGLWRGEDFTHNGEFFQIENVKFMPGPRQNPRVPNLGGGILAQQATDAQGGSLGRDVSFEAAAGAIGRAGAWCCSMVDALASAAGIWPKQ
jgi:luciferase-like monooxygenase